MESVAYGLFPDRETADAAIAELERHGLPEDVVKLSEYDGEIADEDIPGAASRSRPNAVISGVLAAVLGAILGVFVLGGRLGINPFSAGAILALGAGLLGALLGTITGSTIPRPELEALGGEVADGKVLVTIDSKSEVTNEALIAELEELGAIRTGLMSGLGLGPPESGARRGPSS